MNKPKHISHLSGKRIVISLLIFLMIPVMREIVFRLVHDYTLAYTFALNLAGFLLLVYDWNLFGIHYNRAKSNLLNTLIYTLVGIVFIGLWLWVDLSFLHADILISSAESTSSYAFGSPAIMLAFSFVQGLIINISFKCMTDHMNIHDRELIVILVSGFLFGLIYTLVFMTSFDIPLLVRTYLYNVVLVSILSYLYNQSTSFIPGVLAFGFVMLAVQLMNFLAL